jgi:hypothetical protein
MLAADIERYSRRTTALQDEAQRLLVDTMLAAAQEAGISPSDVQRQASGDGQLVVLPADVDEAHVVATHLRVLDRRLREYNRTRVPGAKVRIRLAVHFGPVASGSNGFTGPAAVDVCRLVDAPALKRALAVFPEAALAAIVSDVIHEDVVAEQHAGLRPERFLSVPVAIPEKGFERRGWICVADEDVTARAEQIAEAAIAPNTPAAASGTATPAPPRGSGISVGTISSSGQVAIGDGSTAVGTAHHGPGGGR